MINNERTKPLSAFRGPTAKEKTFFQTNHPTDKLASEMESRSDWLEPSEFQTLERYFIFLQMDDNSFDFIRELVGIQPVGFCKRAN